MQLRRVVDTDRKEKGPASRHEVGALVGEVPFEPEVALSAGLRTPGDDRDEERTRANLAANRLIPGIAAAQFVLVEPDLDATLTQALGNASRRLGILRGVAEKYRARRFRHVDATLS